LVNRSYKPVQFKNQMLSGGKYKDVFTGKVIKDAYLEPMNLVVLAN